MSELPLGPMLLRPILKEKVWGGDRLSRFPAKGVQPGSLVGESWEASGLSGSDSFVGSGPQQGVGLAQLVRQLGARLTGPAADEEFPLLLKFIDARERLSLQVHPPHRRESDPGAPPGKAEAWYVLEGGELVLGLAPGARPAELTQLIQAGQDPSPLLNFLRVQPGDTIPVPPGTLHCIGAGVLVVEVQQPADVTYRVHDWGREGRELHLARALEVLDPCAGRWSCPPPLEWEHSGNDFKFLTGCRHFGMELATLRERAPWVRAGQSVELLLCLEGRVRVVPESGQGIVEIEPGETVMFPAEMVPVWMEPVEPATLLVSYPCRLERELYDRLLPWGHSGAAVAERLFPA